jgi:hypothetical protein
MIILESFVTIFDSSNAVPGMAFIVFRVKLRGCWNSSENWPEQISEAKCRHIKKSTR